jgi:DNA-binding NarL/FixJ family response regulator
MTIRVHLADDQTMFRECLEALLSTHADGIEVVGRSSTGGEDVGTLVERNKPDVVIAEVDQDPNTAKDVLSRIRRASPGSKIVVLTMYDSLRYLKALAGMGIDAYLHKTSSTEELLATIDAASRGPEGGANVVVSMPRGLIERIGDEPAAGVLSERETEIVVLAARGLTNQRIGEQLHISEATVKRHLANVYQKIGVNSRSEAVRKALTEQWIGLGEITSATDRDGSSGG